MAVTLPIVSLAAFLTGCGYTWSNNGSSFSAQTSAASNSIYRQNVHTVAVPIFANQTYFRGIEFSLSKAVVSDLEAHTPYKVVPQDRADTLLEGQVTSVRVVTISRSPFNALPQEQLFIVTVSFTWKDLRSGQILTQRHGFEQTASYYPTLGEDQSIGAQDNIERLARAIVEELQAPWGKTAKTN